MLSRGFKEQIYDVFKFLPEKVSHSLPPPPVIQQGQCSAPPPPPQ